MVVARLVVVLPVAEVGVVEVLVAVELAVVGNVLIKILFRYSSVYYDKKKFSKRIFIAQRRKSA